MGIFENIKMAFTSIRSNKMRAFLTMLGIIIGISAVITITTIGNSIQQTLVKSINQLGGANYFDVDIWLKDDLSEDEITEFYDNNIGMTEEDMITDEMIEELLNKYPDCFEFIKSDDLGMSEIINYNNDYLKSYIIGASEGLLSSNKIKILEGRDISISDIAQKKHTCVVSDLFVRQYFKKGEKAIGETIVINVASGEAYEFNIVGIFKTDEFFMPTNPELTEIEQMTDIYIPITTATKLNGITSNYYDYISLKWNPDKDPEVLKQYLQEFFDEKYAQNKYFSANIMEENEILEMFNNVINIVTIAISVIAAISLIVGGVGVMNIMLVSITERTREIGIRKALGAKNSSIRLQFVIEAIIICLIGGIIGIIIGISNGILIGEIAKNIMKSMLSETMNELIVISIEPSLSAIAISVFFSMLTGVFFGYYPANKAAKMKPIDALRYD